MLFSLYKYRSKLKIFIKVNFYKKKSYFISIKNGYMYIHVNYNKKLHYQKNLYSCILLAKDKVSYQKKKRKKNRIQKYKKMELIIIQNYYGITKYKLSIYCFFFF